MVRSINLFAATALVLPSVTFPLQARSSVRAPLLAFDPIPAPIPSLSPVHATQHTHDFIQRAAPSRSHYVYNPQDDSSDSDSDWEEGPCNWCHGDYYPCRCDEKGRNTASMAQKSSPPHSAYSVRYRPPPMRNHGAQLAVLSAIEVTIDGTPCKWCLGTFVPCFCEDGVPDKAVEQFDHDPAESSEILALGNVRKSNTFMITSGSRMDVRRTSLSVKTSVSSTEDERSVRV